MAKGARAMAESRAEARRLADLVEEAIEEGATRAEEIHKSIARLPLEMLEDLNLFADVVKDVREIQETSIGAIYDAIRKVSREGARLAEDLLEAPAPRRRPRKRTARAKAA